MSAAVASRTLLSLHDLHVFLGQSHVLQGVTFDVHEGGVTALLACDTPAAVMANETVQSAYLGEAL